jgi:hypothetical protein
MVNAGRGFAAHLGVGVTGGLSLGGGVRLGDFAFFAAGGGLGDGGGLGTAGSFDALGGGGTRCFLGLAQSTAHGGLGIFCLMGAGCLSCLTSGRLCSSGGGFGFGLGQQGLLADLLGRTMPQLCAVLAARCREVAILRSVKVRPGIENSDIFGGLRYYRIFVPVRAVRIHFPGPCASVTPRLRHWFYLNCAGSLPVQKDVFAPVIMQ